MTGNRMPSNSLFGGPGELRALYRAVDWSATALGPMERWPSSLRTAVRMCLDAKTVPMAIWAGRDLTLIYNDGYPPVLGPKHPWALARPAREVWDEFWDRLGPELQGVMERGESTHHQDERFLLRRDGAEEEAYFTYSYTPVREEDGTIVAALNVFHETTEIVRSAAQREELLSFALSTAQAGAWSYDLEDQSTRRSMQHARIFGYDRPPPDWTYETFLEHVIPEDRPRVDRIFRQAIKTRSDWSFECRITRRDGERRWIWVAGRLLPDPKHRLAAGIVQDITERKRVEEAVRANEALARRRLAELEATYETAPIGLCVFDENLRWVRVNEIIAEMNGKPIEEHLGRTPSEVVPDMGAQAEEALRTILRTGERLDFEMNGTTPAQPGVQRSWSEHWAPIKDETGRVVAISVAAEEITDQKRAAQALAESEERFRTLADNIAQFAWIGDGDGKVWWFNQRWYDYTGTTPEEMLGDGARRLHHPDHVDRVLAGFQRCVRSGESWEDTFPLRGKDGTYRWFLSRAIPIRDSTGKLVRWFGTNTDVTEQRAAEEALREANERLVEADLRKNEFLAVLSHELRNPLAPVRNSVYILERAAPGGEQAKRARQVIERQTQHMTRLVEDLLDVTRISKGKITLQRERVDLAAVVRGTAEDHREVYARSGVALEVAAPDEPLWIDGDPTRLSQVIGNLLNNSVKFTPRGGSTALGVETNARGEAVIRVRDDGAGMSPETMKHLFEPFVQGTQTIERARGGLGLGLALVKGLVELHGGRVEVASDGEGRGSEFTLTLPLQAPARPKLSVVPPPKQRSPSARRVLIIEDNVDAADSLREALELGDHEVRVAYTGPEGLEAARASEPDVVLCDLGLPGLDGYGVARALRTDPDARLRSTVLVALSGYALAEDVARSKEAGFDRHIAKPPSIDALERLLADTPGATSAVRGR